MSMRNYRHCIEKLPKNTAFTLAAPNIKTISTSIYQISNAFNVTALRVRKVVDKLTAVIGKCL